MNMRKEDRLIFLFSRLNPDKYEISRIEELLKTRPDWDYILEKSWNEGVSCLVYYHLNNSEFKAYVPSQYLEQLRNYYHRNSARNMIISGETKKILKIFNEENIKAIVLKGIFLAENIYKNIAFRPIGDIDILVRKDDLSEVDKILKSSGFLATTNHRDALSIAPPSPVNSLVYLKKTPGAVVHLHWHLINTTWPLDSLVNKIDMERIWSCARATRIGGIEALTLAPEHLLIYLSQHSLTHSFDRLILLADILETLRHYKERLDYELVVGEAERFNLSPVLFYSLSFASNLLNFEIPELERLKPAGFSLSDRIFSLFMRKGVRHYWLSYLIYLSMEKGFFSKLSFMGRTLFPSPYVMGHNFALPLSNINAFHYYRRIVRNFF